MKFKFTFTKEVIARIRYWKASDRLGPDIPWTHWRLYFKSTMAELSKKKFKRFGAGAEFRPGANAVTCSKIELGNNVVIRPGTMLFADPRLTNEGEILIEDDVMLGSGVQIYVAHHCYNNPNLPIIHQGHMQSQTVRLRKGCWIGANAIIFAGVEIGENYVVGAGSIVTKDIPSKCVAIGSPARVIKNISDTRKS